MLPLISRPTLASSSRLVIRCASSSAQNPHLTVPSDSRTDTIRQTLYPPSSPNPASSSPTGTYRPQHAERVEAVISSAEAHETIERAWRLFQREKRKEKETILTAKFNAMVDACEELDRVTAAEEGGGGRYPRYIYDRAMAKPSFAAPEEARGKKGSEGRWLEARLEGMVPREQWVPTETRGKGWNYGWKRPGNVSTLHLAELDANFGLCKLIRLSDSSTWLWGILGSAMH